MPVMRWRVVCAFEVIIDIRSPTNRFIRVDLPTLGLPTMFTKPALCAITQSPCCFGAKLFFLIKKNKTDIKSSQLQVECAPHREWLPCRRGLQPPTLYNEQKTHQSVFIAEMMHFLLIIFRKSSKASSLRFAVVYATSCAPAWCVTRGGVP